MLSNLQYQNPDSSVDSRPLYAIDSATFQIMMLRVHEGATCPNPRVYDATHHSLETRTSKSSHQNCTLFTPKYYSGKTPQETETKFLQLIVPFGHKVQNNVRAVFFRDLTQGQSKIAPKNPVKETLQNGSFPFLPPVFPGFATWNSPYSFPQISSNIVQSSQFPFFPSSSMMMNSPLPSPIHEVKKEDTQEESEIKEDEMFRLKQSIAQLQNQITGIFNIIQKNTKNDNADEPSTTDLRGNEQSNRGRGRGGGRRRGGGRGSTNNKKR